MLHCAPERFPVVCPWLKTPYFFPTIPRTDARGASSSSLFRRFRRRTPAPFAPEYSRQYAENQRRGVSGSRVSPYGWQLTPVPWCKEGFWIERDDEESLPLGSTAEHLSGLFYIQEASSMLPVAALFADGNQPERVMDVAAAPGSKTTQIAARMNNRGAILANDFRQPR